MNHNQILDMIDNIDYITEQSEVMVIESMIEIFDKSMTIMEYYEGDDTSAFSIFQEGEILDQVKKESKNDSNKFITILKFLPRLIRAFIQSLKVPEDGKEKAHKFKKNVNKLEGLSMSEKKEKVKLLNEEFNGQAECYIDEKTGKIKFKKDKGEFLLKLSMHGALILSTHNLMNRMKAELDIMNPGSIRKFIDDCDKVLCGDKSITKKDLFDGGLEAIGDLMKDFFAISGELSLICAEVSTKLDDMIKKDMIKDYPNEKKQEIMKNINDLSNRIGKINGMIAATVGSFGVLRDWGNFFNDIIGDVSKSNKERDEIMAKAEAEINTKLPNETDREFNKRRLDRYDELVKEKKKEKKAEIKEFKQQKKDERNARHEMKKSNNKPVL